VTNTQLTLVQIDNYGPWTVTPEPRREMDLQTMQSRLFADLANFVGARDGYVFFTRFDNMIAVTNGLSYEDHALLQESIGNRYPVTVSLGIGVLKGAPIEATARSDDDVRIAHFDVNDATEKYTDQLNEFDSFIEIEQGYAALMRYMREAHGALSFFVGGDNIIAACPALSTEAYHTAIDHVEESVGVELKVGVGVGATAHEAGMTAKHALETCRHDGTVVEFGSHAAPAEVESD
jgi:GTP cyclohydrolase IIa